MRGRHLINDGRHLGSKLDRPSPLHWLHKSLWQAWLSSREIPPCLVKLEIIEIGPDGQPRPKPAARQAGLFQ